MVERFGYISYLSENVAFHLDFTNIFILTIAIVNAILGFTIYFKNRKSITNLSFFLTLMAVVFWGISVAFFRGFSDKETILLFYRLAFFFGGLISFVFYYFSLAFPYDYYNFNKTQKYLIPLPFLVLAFISLTPNILVIDVQKIPDTENILIFNQYANIIYILILSFYFVLAYYVLTKKYWQFQGNYKDQISRVIFSTSISVIIAFFTNLILPSFGIFNLNWFGAVAVIIMSVSIFLSIIKYHLFNVQIVATEIFVFVLWIFTFVQFLVADYTILKITNAFLFLVMLIAGLLLIRSVIKEVEQRRELTNLNILKNQFLSFASHQLKNPLAVIRGYAQLMLENKDNEDKLINFYKKITNKIDDLLNLIEIFVNYRKIEEKKLDFKFELVNVVDLVKEVSDGIKILAAEKNLDFSFKTSSEKIMVKVDPLKFTQVIQNILDNAIKYTRSGFVRIEIYTNDDTKEVIIKISDSGIGLDKNDKLKLFDQFYRSINVKNYIEGSGLGLYVAKYIIEAHNGKIWAESEGINKGSTFFISLPLS